MLLLLLHLLQNSIFLDLDQVPPLLLTKTQPELLDPFPLFGGARAPDLVCVGFALLVG